MAWEVSSLLPLSLMNGDITDAQWPLPLSLSLTHYDVEERGTAGILPHNGRHRGVHRRHNPLLGLQRVQRLHTGNGGRWGEEGKRSGTTYTTENRPFCEFPKKMHTNHDIVLF